MKKDTILTPNDQARGLKVFEIPVVLTVIGKDSTHAISHISEMIDYNLSDIRGFVTNGHVVQVN